MASSILITGGAGFVGSALALRLRQEWPTSKIVCMDNLYRKGSEYNVPRLESAGINFHQGDIRLRSEFPVGPFEYILECSAEPSVLAGYQESPDYLMQTNLMGAYECLEMARHWQSKLLFFSTSRVYPIAAMEQHPWEETATRFEWVDGNSGCISSRGVREELLTLNSSARSLYGFTKYAGELLIEEYREAFGLGAIINRCSVLAGPGQFGKSDQGVVALWVIRHLLKRPLSYIGYGGKGKQVRDVLHIDDLADLVVRQIQEFSNWTGWKGNVGGGRAMSLSLMELTELCREATGIQLEIGSDPEPRQADLRIFLADCLKIEKDFGWRPRRDSSAIVNDIAQWLDREPSILDALGKI